MEVVYVLYYQKEPHLILKNNGWQLNGAYCYGDVQAFGSKGGVIFKFSVLNFNNNYIDGDTLYHSNGSSSEQNYMIRPIVILNSNVNFQWNSTNNQWEIQ